MVDCLHSSLSERTSFAKAGSVRGLSKLVCIRAKKISFRVTLLALSCVIVGVLLTSHRRKSRALPLRHPSMLFQVAHLPNPSVLAVVESPIWWFTSILIPPTSSNLLGLCLWRQVSSAERLKAGFVFTPATLTH